MPKDAYHCMLLRCVADIPQEQRGKLHQLIAAKVLSPNNTAQLERDLNSLRDLWHKRTKKIDSLKLQKQLRLRLNYMERKDSWGDEEIYTRIAAAWSKRQDKKERRERSAKRKYEIHLANAEGSSSE